MTTLTARARHAPTIHHSSFNKNLTFRLTILYKYISGTLFKMNKYSFPTKGVAMASVHDVAAYILEKQGTTTTMKLQKLVYYSQAWSLVWEDRPLFGSQIQAWANGPVVRALYEIHRGHFTLSIWATGNPDNLSQKDRETIDAVLEFYGGRSSQWLVDLTHQEPPWRNARKGLSPGERGNHQIKLADMAEYYGSL